MTEPTGSLRYDPIVVSAESTVVAYVSETAEAAAYQVVWRHFHSCGIFTA